MKLLITGSKGFIGKNLSLRLREYHNIELLTFERGQDISYLTQALDSADAVIHLAGENRPDSPEAFEEVNVGLTHELCQALRNLVKKLPVIFTSSTQADQDNAYGRSKLAAEHLLIKLAKENGNPVVLYRLPGVFGKWSRPHYNSVVATFCYQKARDLPVVIDNPNTKVTLVYIDDVITSIIQALQFSLSGVSWPELSPQYSITIEELSRQIDAFKDCRNNLIVEPVGKGLVRALYATYMSYLPPEKFSYTLAKYSDTRGTFVEMLKTVNSGQFSFFTSLPGVTRGGHFHHTKTEKFLVLIGQARFRFRNMDTGERYELITSAVKPEVVEIAPGWTHDITNIGSEEMIVLLWSNEIFDRYNPDTIASPL